MHGPKFLSVLLGLVSVPVASVMAQASARQCGGNGWNGPTTCVSGYTCTYYSDWYSQCTPGAAGTTTISSAAYKYTSSAASTTTSTPTSNTASTPTGATVLSGQWDNVQTSNNYILHNNLWGMSAATSGSQSTTLLSTNGKTISWKTAWSWAGGQSNVKSFANAKLVFTPKKISEISTIPSKMKYTYTGDSMVADVAYDIFTASTSGGDAEYEVMIWLASYGGAGPISSTGSPVVSGLRLAGQTWNLFKGPNGSMTVFSFVVTSNSGVVSNFSGDAKTFLTYLTTNQTMPASQYVNSVQCGTEPFTGSNAVLTVSAFSVAVN